MSRNAVMVGVLLLTTGLLAGWILHAGTSEPAEASGEVERGQIRGVRLTSPFIEPPGARDSDTRLTRIRGRMADQVAEARRADPTLSVSVYVRDLETGAWMGLDEDRGYVPASLMKVAVLFHSLERIEADPGFADSTRHYPGAEEMRSPENLWGDAAVHRMRAGQAYPVRELIERMLVHSDNHAKDLLLAGVPTSTIDSLMARLDVPARFDEVGRAVMTARTYSALFRVLYHSSVFSRRTSEFALELLSVADFERGMRSGVPPGVTVASKFGIHFDGADLDAGQQLHECGIVYAPPRPFTLCIMTQSLLAPAPVLSDLIADITRSAWDGMTASRPVSGGVADTT